ncbi:Iron-sulfur protein IND1 [Spathaspora sp. JA1]|nr:Iron-sulfur protein IND1 [Spathaspora sp. JA1]
MLRLTRRYLSQSLHTYHENPLGIPRKGPAPKMQKGLPIRQKIPNVNKIILVSSAKGGVGKSTVSVNTALALKTLGSKVGILDADIFGPSIPRLLNLSGEPRLSDTGKLIPLSNYGVQSMSMGYLVSPDQAVVWRGLMVMKALQQLLFEVEWSPIDYLIIDMPPGTGDTQLSIGQLLQVDGAVIVSTPQDIALIDAVKGIKMFQKVNIPIIGIVQNMSHFICPNCKHESHIFKSEGARRIANEHNLNTLASIPLDEQICVQSDAGKPIVISDPDSLIVKPYFDIARPLLLVSGAGVPVHYNGHVPKKNKQEIQSKRIVMFTKLETFYSTLIKSEVEEEETITASQDNLETDVPIVEDGESSVYDQPITALSLDTGTTRYHDNVTTEIADNTLSLTTTEPKQEIQAIEEVKRLEQLLFDLRQEMLHQQESFRQMLSIYHNAPKVQPTSSTEPELSETDKPLVWDHEKNHAKNVLNQKNPSNSVFIVPQFQNHKKENDISEYHSYAKPKVAWNDVVLTSDTIKFDEIFPYTAPEPSTILQPMETGEDFEETITYESPDSIFHVPKHLKQSETKTTESEELETFTVTETATITKRRINRFKNYNSTINFDVFHLDVSENKGVEYKYSVSAWLFACLLMFIH